MASLIEHADAIKAAIKAAEEDGFRLECDVTYDRYDGITEVIEVDLWDKGTYVNVFTEDRS